MNSLKPQSHSAALADLKIRIDRLGQPNLARTGLASIYGGGDIDRPRLALVFMNPTRRNVSSRPDWTGPRLPFIGISRFWTWLNQCQLLAQDPIQELNQPPDQLTPATVRGLEKYLIEAGLYITNVIKETADNSQLPRAAVFKRYQALLYREMTIIQPQLIVAFGLEAHKSLTGITIRLEEIYQRSLTRHKVPIVGDCQNIPVAPCYFPIGRGNRQRATVILDMIAQGQTDRRPN